MTETTPGRVALVTGGSRGIGRAIVEELARTGCKVAFTYSSNAAAAEQVAAGLRQEACAVEFLQADARDFQRAAEVIARKAGTLPDPQPGEGGQPAPGISPVSWRLRR